MSEDPGANLAAQYGGPSYLGPATFSKLPLVTEPEDLDRIRPDAAIVGAPWDDSVTFRPGARFGPRAVRTANYQPQGRHLDLDVAPFEVLRVVDYGDAVCAPGMAEASHAGIRERVAEIATRGIIPFVIGGGERICSAERRDGPFRRTRRYRSEQLGKPAFSWRADAPAHRVGCDRGG